MPKKSHGLGRGLDALLPVDTPEEDKASIQEIAIGQIDPNQDQPRKLFADDLIDQLADSIQSQGVLQPLLVYPTGNGRYQIIAGERRWRAAMKAGVRSVPCLVRDMDAKQRMEVALIENLQREDLNAVEIAVGIRALMDDCGYTQEEAAKRLSKSRPAVANYLRLLNLPEKVLDMIRQGTLSAGHARVLAGLDDPKEQEELAEAVIAEGMSVRQLEQRAAERKESKTVEDRADQEEKKKTIQSTEMKALENRIRETIGMRASLKGTESKGKIVLEYYTQDELEHFNELLQKMESMENDVP